MEKKRINPWHWTIALSVIAVFSYAGFFYEYSKAKDLKVEMKKMENTIARLEAEHSKFAKEKAALKKQIADLKKALDRSQEEIADLKKVITEKENLIHELKTDNRNKNTQIIQLGRNIKALNEKSDALRLSGNAKDKEIIDLQKELYDIRIAKRGLEGKVKDNEDVIGKQEEDVRMANEQLRKNRAKEEQQRINAIIAEHTTVKMTRIEVFDKKGKKIKNKIPKKKNNYWTKASFGLEIYNEKDPKILEGKTLEIEVLEVDVATQNYKVIDYNESNRGDNRILRITLPSDLEPPYRVATEFSNYIRKKGDLYRLRLYYLPEPKSNPKHRIPIQIDAALYFIFDGKVVNEKLLKRLAKR